MTKYPKVIWLTADGIFHILYLYGDEISAWANDIQHRHELMCVSRFLFESVFLFHWPFVLQIFSGSTTTSCIADKTTQYIKIIGHDDIEIVRTTLILEAY